MKKKMAEMKALEEQQAKQKEGTGREGWLIFLFLFFEHTFFARFLSEKKGCSRVLDERTRSQSIELEVKQTRARREREIERERERENNNRT